MDKLDMHSRDGVKSNVEKIRELFPNVVTEVARDGKPEYKVDFDALKQQLSSDLIEKGEESYQFTWEGKQKALLLANTPLKKTLRPVKEDSIDFDNTQNLYIEGDNLDILKLLQMTYLGKVKMIYIDPPYNAGTSYIYKNNYFQSEKDFKDASTYIDEEGNRMFLNRGSNGRFHADWCSMMYSRLLVARELLTSDGFIAIAIDDNEFHNLKKIADEVFGETNFVGTIVTRSTPQGRNKSNIDPVHEYHFIYAKNISNLTPLKIARRPDSAELKKKKLAPSLSGVGAASYGPLMRTGTNSRKTERPNRFFPLLVKDGKVSTVTREEYEQIYVKNKSFDEEHIKQLKKKYESLGYTFVLPISSEGEEKVWQRVYDRIVAECDTYIYQGGSIKAPKEELRTPVSLWADDIHSNVTYGTNRLKELFGSDVTLFDFPKSIFTVYDLVSADSGEDDIILDFFSGSATTAEAVMQLNANDGGHRRFIMVQLPEKCGEDTEAFKAGYKNICELGRKRIRLAGKKILEENPSLKGVLDVGFRVLKIDSTNMEDVYYTASSTEQGELAIDNVKQDRTPLDLLFQVMLEFDKPLSSKIEEIERSGKKVFHVDGNDLICCFDENISDDVVKEIAMLKPGRVVFRDSSFASDSVRINCDQLFAKFSPNTKRRVI